MQNNRDKRFFAVLFSLVFHLTVFAVVSYFYFGAKKDVVAPPKQAIYMDLQPPPPAKSVSKPVSHPAPPKPAHVPPTPQVSPAPVENAEKQPATKAAPPAPTAEEWAFAAKYTNKNSKAYRYNWGVQVRSMMGTAVEGPDQGTVRFRVTIAPDGRLANLETLWSTSAVAERLARKAIESMPPLPPTPTGKPLIFDRTISFTPFAADAPPTYKDDCEPDPPVFHNPYALKEYATQDDAEHTQTDKLDPKALAECLRQLPKDSIDAVEAEDKRQMDRWGWSNSGK